MKISLTGGAGFIGNKIFNLLRTRGYELKYLTRNTKFYNKKNTYIGDMALKNHNLAQFVFDTNVLINCAGEMKNESKMGATNVDGINNLLDCIEESNLVTPFELFHFIQLSSCGSYGVGTSNTPSHHMVNEDSPTNPQNLYEITKTKADELLIAFAKKHDWFKYTLIRPSIVFGDGMRSHAIKNIAKCMRVGIWLPYSPSAIANYVHVDDVADAIVRCVMNPKAYNQTFIVSNDCAMSQFMQGIQSGLFKASWLRTLNTFLGCISSAMIRCLPNALTKNKPAVLSRSVRFSHTHIKHTLGWSPSASVPEQVSQFVRFLK